MLVGNKCVCAFSYQFAEIFTMVPLLSLYFKNKVTGFIFLLYVIKDGFKKDPSIIVVLT